MFLTLRFLSLQEQASADVVELLSGIGEMNCYIRKYLWLSKLRVSGLLQEVPRSSHKAGPLRR